MESEKLTCCGFADRGRGPCAQECGQPLEAGKVQGTDSALDATERSMALPDF